MVTLLKMGPTGKPTWEDEVVGNGRPVAPAWVPWGGGESGALRPSWAPGGEFGPSLGVLPSSEEGRGLPSPDPAALSAVALGMVM